MITDLKCRRGDLVHQECGNGVGRIRTKSLEEEVQSEAAVALPTVRWGVTVLYSMFVVYRSNGNGTADLVWVGE